VKSPFTLIRREFQKYLYGESQAPWRVAETEKRRTVESADLMATNGLCVVVVTYLGKTTFRVTAYSVDGRTVAVVTGATKVYDTAIHLLKCLPMLRIDPIDPNQR